RDAAPEVVLLLGRELHLHLLREVDRARDRRGHDVARPPRPGPAEPQARRVAGDVAGVARPEDERRGRDRRGHREPTGAAHLGFPRWPAITKSSTSFDPAR